MKKQPIAKTADEFHEALQQYCKFISRTKTRTDAEQVEYLRVQEIVSAGNPDPYPGYKKLAPGLESTGRRKLLAPLLDSFHKAFDVVRKPGKVEYDGYPTLMWAATTPQPIDFLNMEGEDTLELFFAVAFQLGAEEGRREGIREDRKNTHHKLENVMRKAIRETIFETDDEEQ